MQSLPKRIILIFVLLFILPRLSFAEETPEIFVQMGHSHTINSVTFSPDGRYALSGSSDTTIKLWEISTGKEIRTLHGHSSFVNSVAFSPDGKYALSGGGDKTVKLWEVSTGKELRTLVGHPGDVKSVTFSPDGRYALSAGYDTTIKLWKVPSGVEIRTFEKKKYYSYSVTTVAFSPDGRYILAGENNGSIRLWEASTGRELKTLTEGERESIITSIAFSPDGRYALSGSFDKTVRLWEISTGRELRTFQKNEKVNSVAFSHDGKYAISGGNETIKLWEVSTGKEIRTLQEQRAFAVTISFSPDGLYILSAGYDNTIRLWEISTGKELRSFKGYSDSVYSIAFSPDGQHIISGYGDHMVRLWDVSAGRGDRVLRGSMESSDSQKVVFSPDGKKALSGTYSGRVQLWEVSTGRELAELKGQSEIISVAFSPDGRYIYSGSRDGTARFWDSSLRSDVQTLKMGRVLHQTLSPDGRYILSGGYYDKTTLYDSVKLWEVAAGKEVKVFNAYYGTSVTFLVFSPDGRYAISAAGMFDKSIRLWEMSTGKEVRRLVGHSGDVNVAVFSPDGKYIMSGSQDKTARIWEVSTGKELMSLNTSFWVYSVAFSPDGRHVLSGSIDGAIKIWDATTGREICSMIGFRDGEWVAITPEGYFNASPNGAKHLNVRVGNQVYSIDNFYEKFFNPVYVASVLQGKKVEPLADIRKGIMSPPDVQITSPKANATISNDMISVTVSAKDTGGRIDEIRLYHNGKAVGEDTRAVKLAPKGKEATKTYTVTLIDGINIFRAVGFSKDRTESNPYELVVHLSAPQKDISMHVLAVGINKYRNPALNLNYAVPDAKGITEFFNEKGNGLFKKVDVTDVYDENATKENITSRLKNLENTNPQDVVLIYLAGHGENISDKWYFIPYELAYPEREDEVKSKGISSDELAGLIRNIKAQKLLVMIDSCKAGAMLIAMRGFEDRKALSQLSRSTGVHVIAASTKDQFAAEVKELGHGVFTYTLLEGLKGQASTGNDKTVTVRKLMTHVENRLPDITMKYRNEAQFPVVDSRGMDFPLVIMK